MHELLAPLFYVLHIDVQHFKQVKELHEELLGDDFDGQTFPDRFLLNRSDRTNNSEGGADGELGIILSEKFM